MLFRSRWLDEPCRTSAMFATTWGRYAAEHLAVFGAWEEVPERGDYVEILEPDHPLFDGIAAGGLNNWASTFHTRFRAWPPEFEMVASDDAADAIIVLRESLGEPE